MTGKDCEDVDEQGLTRDFRAAMRRLASGVALVTSADSQRSYGMPMTAVMSLSMEPPSLAIAVNRSASIYGALQAGAPFAVNLLRRESKGMCRTFSALPSAERFKIGDWAEDRLGIPYLMNAQATIFCHVGPRQPFGSHVIVVGIVSHVIVRHDVDPLIHIDGQYRSISRQ